ncbi:hypothetical protein [Vibrio vulnificus YJ016]|uniref:Uncharacterized protein n=1 Tax=Vibrio vulnificus (strain YJ016) TaxID=196600 RepID=Q7MPK4_VIBVY|nr:hypothetical protein [Vibrio vulnificus YJ016]
MPGLRLKMCIGMKLDNIVVLVTATILGAVIKDMSLFQTVR